MPDLCQLSDVTNALGSAAPIAGNGDGTKILAQYASLITAASAAFLNSTNRRTISSASFTETRSGSGQIALVLRAFPIISVSALTIDGIAWTPYSGSGQGYAVADNGYEIELVGGCASPGVRNVVIAYEAGYATIPADIVQAVVEMVLWKKAKMGRIDQVSVSLNGAETTSFDRSSIPPSAKDTIRQYTDYGGFRG